MPELEAVCQRCRRLLRSPDELLRRLCERCAAELEDDWDGYDYV